MTDRPLSEEKRLFDVEGVVTVTCWVKIKATSESEAIEKAQAGEYTESYETEHDGDPQWTRAREVKS